MDLKSFQADEPFLQALYTDIRGCFKNICTILRECNIERKENVELHGQGKLLHLFKGCFHKYCFQPPYIYGLYSISLSTLSDLL